MWVAQVEGDVSRLPEQAVDVGGGGSGCPGAGVLSAIPAAAETHWMRPAGLNLTIMSEPLSTAQMLSFLSMRTVWATTRRSCLCRSADILPWASNSSSCAAAGAKAEPVALLERVNTKTWPLEFTATRHLTEFMPFGVG
jgi:hypothetical protein